MCGVDDDDDDDDGDDGDDDDDDDDAIMVLGRSILCLNGHMMSTW